MSEGNKLHGVRGGSWGTDAMWIDIDERSNNRAMARYSIQGFRIVRVVTPMDRLFGQMGVSDGK